MTELTVKGGYAISCSLLGWPGVSLWVKQELLQLAVPLQGPVWTLVFCASRLELELFLLLVFIMPFELVVPVPDLHGIGTQPVPFK